MILTDRMLKEAVAEGGIKIDPFNDDQVQAATYDLRVGDEAVTTSSTEVRNLVEKGFVIFEPGDFGFVVTKEIVELSPEYVARFGLRSKFARKGLIGITGPQIDPGYRGRLIIGLSNLTPNPISLAHEEHLVSVEFHKLSRPVERPYSGPYQGVMNLRPEEISLVTEKKGMLLSEMQATLSSLSANVGAIRVDFGALRNELRHFEITIGTIIAALAILLTVITLVKH